MKEKNNVKKSIPKKVIKVIIYLLVAVIIFLILVIVYEFFTRNKTYYISEKNIEIPIYIYHDIVKDESEIEYDFMQTTVDTFEKQITGLMKLGYKPISYQDLVDYKNGKKALSKWSFLITFDDGYMGVYKYAYEIAKKYDIPMTTFVIDDCVGIQNYFNWEQAKEMHDSGVMDIYSHGLTHTEYDKVDTLELVNQTNQAYENLKVNLDDEQLLKVFTYPYGLYTNDDVKALEDEGYIQNLTDNKVNESKNLNLSKLHRYYPLSASSFKLFLKNTYIVLKYGSEN